MPYCTTDQLTDRFGQALLLQLSDRGDVVPEEIDADLFARAIADADALIDGYLAARYALPLETVPAIVTDLSQRIAIYYAHGQTVADKIAEDYKFALRQLADLSAGRMKLDVAGVEPAGSGGGSVTVNDAERQMTPANLKGFV